MNKQRKVVITTTYNEMGIIIDTKVEEVAQPNLQPTATDTISRAAAIEALDKCHCGGKDENGRPWIYKENAVEAIEMVEPSPPAEPHWIPVTERLPEEHEWLGTKRFGTTISDEVYVTFENPKGERFCKHLSFQKGKLSAFDQSTIDAFFKGSRPVAWKPMPEPYKGVNV